MKHFGDITKLNGSEVPIVDVVCGGSPCQDLSCAGKRAGLAGERSGLFMEQIRIIKEMREHDRTVRGADVDIRLLRPRYMVWENVPGAFSSNQGEDFRCVLEETARIADKNAIIPRLEDKQRWSPSGCIMGDGWSIAWRVHDAQFWGVPQRRKRIALVADFGGETAPQILFESKSLSGNSEQSGETGEGTSDNPQRSVDPSSYTLKIRGGVDVDSNGKKAGKGALVQTELSGTLGVSQDQTLITHQKQIEEWCDAVNKDAKHQQDLIQSDLGVARTLACGTHGSGPHLTKTLITNKVYGISAYESNAMKSPNPHSGIYEADTTRTLDNNGGNPACNQGGMIVLEGNGSRESHKGNGYNESDKMYTLNTVEQHAIVDTYQKTTGSLCASGYDKLGTQEAANDMYVVQSCSWDGSQVSPTLTQNNAGGGQRMPDKDNFNAVVQSLEVYHCTAGDDIVQTLKARDYKDPHVVAYAVDCYNQTESEEVTKALNSSATDSDHIPCVYGIDRASFNQGRNAKYDFSVDEEKAQTLVSRGPGGY